MGALTETSRAARRCSISITSFSFTSSRCAMSLGAGEKPSRSRRSRSFCRLKKSFRCADLHHPPVVHDVADDVRADPPDRVGRKADTAVRVEVLDRLEQADVAFLDEVGQV